VSSSPVRTISQQYSAQKILERSVLYLLFSASLTTRTLQSEKKQKFDGSPTPECFAVSFCHSRRHCTLHSARVQWCRCVRFTCDTQRLSTSSAKTMTTGLNRHFCSTQLEVCDCANCNVGI